MGAVSEAAGQVGKVLKYEGVLHWVLDKTVLFI